MRLRIRRSSLALAIAAAFCLAGCGQSSPSLGSSSGGAQAGSSPPAAAFPPAPAAETTGGFDGTRAYKHVEQLVAIGPHSAGSDGIHRAQAYIIEQLKSFG